ncbi:hypothetical protein [Leucobacter chromiireducens]|uniref:hypothetical protein n=1 Tax=Leucobacter chromiireducens TaxID=283877 RepID=UPI000F640406|nr:hypothetical protein [Leucobacter chromiireducens]
MSEMTTRERNNVRRFAWQIGIAAVLYLALFLGGGGIADPGTPLGVVLGLLPILPVLWMLLATLGFVRGLDEFMKPRMMSAAAVGFVAAMLAAVVLGMVETVIGPIPFALWGVFVIGMTSWGGAAMVISYRAAT